jgi:hypothetical protein
LHEHTVGSIGEKQMRDERVEPGDERTAALEALGRYRTTEQVTDASTACLLDGARRIERADGRERRREALLERAAGDGIDREFAELVYEMAQQEGVEPAFAFELVRCGVGVLDLEHIVYEDGTEEDGMQMQGPPEELILPDSPRPAAADRERRLRLSFRRLRRHIDEQPTAEDALVAFTAEDDVGRCRY